MRYRIIKISLYLYRLFLIFAMIFLVAFTLFMFNGYMEKGVVDSTISVFKARGELECETEIQGQKVTIYKVKPKYSYEINDNRIVFDTSFESMHYIGSKTDIILTTRNPLRFQNGAIVQDFGAFFSQRFFIGHATINSEDDGSKCIESVGNDNIFYGVRETENTWISTEVRKGNDAQKIIGLRIKNTTEDKRKNICTDLKNLLGKRYNAFFLISRKNSYYCTDLITRVLKKNGININYDSLFATGNDIIVSDNTFPIFLCERISDGIFEIYYMSEE